MAGRANSKTGDMTLLAPALVVYATATAGLLIAILAGLCRRGCSREPSSTVGPTIGVVIPAYNAGRHLRDIEAILTLAHELGLACAVVDDGSTDGSAEDLAALCARWNARTLRHAVNRGKPAALNTGVSALDTDLIATIDADTCLAEGDLRRAADEFLDPSVATVAIEIRAARLGLLSRVQAHEYRYILDLERQGLSRLGEVYTVPGAASLWRRQALAEIGGFSDRTLAEDTDATIALRAAGWRAIAVPDASSVTIPPGTLPALTRQRIRWIWGTLQACTRHLMSAITGAVPNRRPALLLGALCGLHVAGFVLPVWSAVALFTGQLTATAAVAMIGLLAIGCARLSAALWYRDRSLARLPTLIASIILIQAINTVSFWLGVLLGAPMRRRWR